MLIFQTHCSGSCCVYISSFRDHSDFSMVLSAATCRTLSHMNFSWVFIYEFPIWHKPVQRINSFYLLYCPLLWPSHRLSLQLYTFPNKNGQNVSVVLLFFNSTNCDLYIYFKMVLEKPEHSFIVSQKSDPQRRFLGEGGHLT